MTLMTIGTAAVMPRTVGTDVAPQREIVGAARETVPHATSSDGPAA